MKVGAKALDRYGERLDAVAEKAGEAAARMYDAMRARNPNTSVEEVREELVSIVESVLASYGDMACEVAADEYDAMARESGAKLPRAELPEIDDEAMSAIEGRIRYIVGDLAHDGERYDI